MEEMKELQLSQKRKKINLYKNDLHALKESLQELQRRSVIEAASSCEPTETITLPDEYKLSAFLYASLFNGRPLLKSILKLINSLTFQQYHSLLISILEKAQQHDVIERLNEVRPYDPK